MNKENFVGLIRQVVADSAISTTIENLENPPGRKPSEKLLESSSWYSNLPDQEKNFVKQIITDSVDEAVFGFLCVLDGVRTISDEDERNKLSLTYHQTDNIVELNGEDGNFLHDLYNAE